MAKDAGYAKQFTGAVRMTARNHWSAQLIGKPYEDFARGPHAFDCWGLVRWVYRQQRDIELPLYGDISPSDLRAVAERMGNPEAQGPWRQVKEPQEFDVMVATARTGGRIGAHVGVMVDHVTVLHIWKKTNACLMPCNHPMIARRILGYWRYESP